MRPTPKYLDYCALRFKMINKRNSKEIAEIIMKTFYATGEIILEPAVLDNHEILSLYDKYLIAIYEADEVPFLRKPRWLSVPQIRFIYSVFNV